MLCLWPSGSVVAHCCSPPSMCFCIHVLVFCFYDVLLRWCTPVLLYSCTPLILYSCTHVLMYPFNCVFIFVFIYEIMSVSMSSRTAGVMSSYRPAVQADYFDSDEVVVQLYEIQNPMWTRNGSDALVIMERISNWLEMAQNCEPSHQLVWKHQPEYCAFLFLSGTRRLDVTGLTPRLKLLAAFTKLWQAHSSSRSVSAQS